MTMDIATLGIRVDATEARLAAVELDRLGAAGGRTATSMSAVERATKLLAGAFAGISAVALARDLLKTVEQVQNLSIRLKGLTKDADDYAKVQAYLVDISNKHHKSNLILADSFSRLLTLEQSGLITRKQSTALLEGMSNASSKTGATTEQLKQSMFGLSQAMGAGVVHMEELNQVTEPMPGLLNKIAEASGYTVGEFRKLIAEGRVTSEVFGKVMVGAFASYQGAAEAAGETLTAKYADIGNAWTELAKAIEAPVVNTISPILELITEQINGLAQDLREINDFYNQVKSALGYGETTTPKAKPAQVDPAKTDTAAIRAEIEATAASTKGKKAHKEAMSEEQKAIISLANAYENQISTLLRSIALEGKSSATAAAEYDVQNGALKGLTESKKLYFLQQTAILQNKQLETKAHEAEKSELDSLIDKYNQLTLSARDYKLTQLNAQGITGSDQAPIMAQFDKTASAEATKKATDDATASLDAYNKKLDDANTKTSDLGAVTSAIFDGALGGITAMAGAFDAMVTSIGNNTKAMEENAAMQKANESEKDPDKQAANSKKYATEEINLNNKVLTDKLKAGSQIAGFLSSSLKKGSTEQRAAHAIQMGLAGAELAMNTAKMMGIDLLTMKEIASVGPSIAASKIKGTAKASEAVATQASAGPYIGFALMAAMAVAMAAIGFATGGGGGGAASGPPPSNSDMGTGTVLGDPTAKSESINHTNDLLQNIHAEEYLELRGINNGVQALSGSILSAVTKQFQLGAIQGVNAPNLGKSGHTMVAGGLQTGEITLGDLLNGNSVFGQMYTTDAKKGGTKEKPTYNYTDYLSPMAAELQKSLTDVFKNIGTTFEELSTKLGPSFSKKINAAIVPALKIDTMGLSGKDAVEKASAVISSTLDKVSAVVFSSLLKYQQLGEGMYETAVRIESEKAIIKDAFAQSGKAMPKVATDAIAMADALVQASGGLEKFQARFAAFMDKFTTDAEKQTRTDKYLNGAFKENKLFNGTQIKGMLSSRDAYGDAVDAAAADVEKYASKKGKKNIAAEKAAVTQYALLLEMAPKVDEYLSYNETLAKDKFELDNTLMKSQGRTAEALAASRKKELDAMEPTLRAIKAQIYAMDDLNAAIKTSLSKMTELSNKLKTALKSTTVESKASLSIDRANANALLKSTLIIARMGGAIENIAGMDKALADIAKPSEQLYSTFEDYARDQAITSSTISELAGFADAQISMAQKQLDATNNTTTAVAGLPDAIASLMGLVAQKKALTPQFASGGFHSGGWRVVGENGPELEQTGASRIFSNGQSKSLLSMDELIAEIQALRADARANAAAVAKNTAETSRIINRWDGDGMPAVRTTV